MNPEKGHGHEQPYKEGWAEKFPFCLKMKAKERFVT